MEPISSSDRRLPRRSGIRLAGPTVRRKSLGRFCKFCAGANSGVRDAFQAGAGERRHGQGGGRRDERVGVRETQRGQF